MSGDGPPGLETGNDEAIYRPRGGPIRNHLTAVGGDGEGYDWDRLLDGGPSMPSSKEPFAGRTWSDDSIRRASQRGTGTAIGHAGEILQGWFRTPSGEVVPGLVTLPRRPIRGGRAVSRG